MFGWVPDLGGWEYAIPVVGQGKLIQDSLSGTGNVTEFVDSLGPGGYLIPGVGQVNLFQDIASGSGPAGDFIKGITGQGAADEATRQQLAALAQGLGAVQGATSGAQTEIDASQADAIRALTEARTSGNQQLASAQAAQQAMLQPYMDRSNQALTQMGNLSGMGGGDAQAQAIAALESSPQFQALVSQGENALLQNATATGGLRGGNTAGALAQFRPQMLSQQIQQQMANLGGIANFGMNPLAQAAGGALSTGQGMAANTLGTGQAIAGANMQGGIANANVGMQGANTLAQLYGARGDAQAAGALAQYQMPRDFLFDLANFGIDVGTLAAGA